MEISLPNTLGEYRDLAVLKKLCTRAGGPENKLINKYLFLFFKKLLVKLSRIQSFPILLVIDSYVN